VFNDIQKNKYNKMSAPITIEVTQENKVCAKCCSRGHSKNETSCRYYTVDMPDQYKTKCSRCNQPGHNRNNRSKCSLREEYPDYVYSSTRRRRQPEIVNVEPNQTLELYTRIEELNRCIERLIMAFIRINQHLINPEGRNQYLQFLITAGLIPRGVSVDEFLNYILNDINVSYTRDLNNQLRLLRRTSNGYNFSIFQMSLTYLSRSLYSYITLLVLDNEVAISYVVGNVNFPSAIERIIQAPGINLNVIKSEKTINETSIECSVCWENINFICEFDCNHKLCGSCVCGIINSRKNANTTINCPMCRLNITTVKCNDDQQIKTINDCLN